MKTATTMTLAERFGYSLGRIGRQLMGLQNRAIDWLNGVGAPPLVGWILSISLVASSLVVLLYFVFWLTLFFVVSFVVAWLFLNQHLDDEVLPKLRDGHSGIGWYNKDNLRVDMGEPDDH